jgi:P-type conjugative transfer protein TrbJ
MRKRSFISASTMMAIVGASIIAPTPGRAGGVTGQATEWTQLLNNGELVALVGKSTEQINNQMTQIAQLAEQIQNQIRMYENMLQNPAQLPFHIWSQVENDLNRLRGLVAQGEGIAFSMSNADDVLRQRFQSYGEFKTGLADGQTFLA